MSSAFIGEIRPFAFDFAFDGWLDCDGRVLPIGAFSGLYSIIGYMYGGSGSNFALPDLRGLVAVGTGQGPGLSYYGLGDKTGTQGVTLTMEELPIHTHAFASQYIKYKDDPAGFSNAPSGKAHPSRYLEHASGNQSFDAYHSMAVKPSETDLLPTAIGPYPAQGGGGMHENRQPFQVVRFCICHDGDYPQFQ
jgi:microcystin-dependent protein